jgi:hypothetical protein
VGDVPGKADGGKKLALFRWCVKRDLRFPQESAYNDNPPLLQTIIYIPLEGFMDLVDKLREIATRLPRQLEHIQTEEATKSALVMPFISALGYNVFDPTEVTPELNADIGVKKGDLSYIVRLQFINLFRLFCSFSGGSPEVLRKKFTNANSESV